MSQTTKIWVVSVTVVVMLGLTVWGSARYCTTFVEVVGVVGSVASVIGLGYVVFQLWETQMLMSATKAAVDDAVSQLQGNQYRYLLFHAGELLSQVRMLVHTHDWRIATVRLGDLRDQCSQLSQLRSGVDSQWQEFAEVARWWAGEFSNGQTNRPHSYSMEKWSDFCERLKDKVSREFDPFSQIRSE